MVQRCGLELDQNLILLWGGSLSLLGAETDMVELVYRGILVIVQLVLTGNTPHPAFRLLRRDVERGALLLAAVWKS